MLTISRTIGHYNLKFLIKFSADRTNGRAIVTVLRPSPVFL